MNLRLILPTLLPLLASLLVATVVPTGASVIPTFCAIVTGLALVAVVAEAPAILADGAVSTSVPWAPSVGLHLTFTLDGLSLLFAGLILGIGVLVIVFARFYLAPHEALRRFYAALMLFMAAMVGVVSSGNLLMLVVFWELTSISSFLLIGFWDHRPESRAGAYQSLIVTGAGGLALLAGVLMIGVGAGTFEIAALIARADEVRNLPLATPALALILVGAFTKSAQFPFHFWLPNAMAAPTPVSAYLHSATMVKAGIFLLARLSPLFAATDLWFYAVTGAGAATMILGGWAALRQTDLKALLAYSTISQLGLIVLLLGYGTELAAVAAVLHILNHATFKAPLFMAAGIVDHEAGSRDLREIGALRRDLPRTALVAYVAVAAMAGLPLLNGFISKELFYEASLALDGAGRWVFPALAVLGSTFTVAYSLRFLVGAFFGTAPRMHRHPHEPPAGMRFPAEVLALLCIVFGVMPWLSEPLVAAAASAVLQQAVHPHFSVWHGFNPALGMSAVAVAAGGLFFYARRETTRRVLPPALGRTASDRYDRAVDGLVGGAVVLANFVQGGRLAWYVRVVVGVTLVLTLAGLGWSWPSVGSQASTQIVAGAPFVVGLTAAAIVSVAAFHRNRLTSVIALGAVGLLLAIYFTWLSAPDLVLTQILVETVTTILIVLVLYFLPKHTADHEAPGRLVGDAGFAAAAGLGAAGVVYAILRRPFESISGYHIAESLPGGGGGNVVNVILVDFRAFDTLGEIAVLAIAAVGVLAMVRAGRRGAA